MLDPKVLEPICRNINKYEPRLQKYLIHTSENNELKNTEHGLHKRVDSVDSDEQEVGKIEGSLHKISRNSQSSQRGFDQGDPCTEKLKDDAQNNKTAGGEKEETVYSEIKAPFWMFEEEIRRRKPGLCIGLYGQLNDIKKLIELDNSVEIRKDIDKRLQDEYPKGISRILVVELMYSVVRYCQKHKFNLEQSGTILSLFYLTHQNFLQSFHTTTSKAYYIFKQYMLLHCIECPPDSKCLFNYEESKDIMQYFCTIYLKNLPLLRLLTLPNFGFSLHYQKPPDLFEVKGGKGKGKDKKGKKK